MARRSPACAETHAHARRYQPAATLAPADELCTGKHAFDARNQAALVVAILLGTYPPLPDAYSAGLRATCDSLLNRDSASRPSVLDILASECLHVYHGALEDGLRLIPPDAPSAAACR